MQSNTLRAALLACLILGLGQASTFAQNGSAAAAVKSEPYVYKSVAIVAGGFIPGIIMSPTQKGLMYCRTDMGGFYRYDAAVKRWIPLVDWAGGSDYNLHGGESLAVDPSDPNRVYLAAGMYTNTTGAILRSTDQGRTFQRTNTNIRMGGNADGRGAGERLMVDPNDGRVLFFGTRMFGLWKSADYGTSWSQVKSFPTPQGQVGVVWVVFDKSSGAPGKPTPTIYAGVSATGPNIYRSSDAGVTWQPVADQPKGLLANHGVLSSDGSLYLTYGNAPGPNSMTDGAIWKYGTKSPKWTDVTPMAPGKNGNPGFGYSGITVDAQHPSTVVATTMDRWSIKDGIFRSTDGGAHWKELGPKATFNQANSPWIALGKPTADIGHWMADIEIDPFDSDHILYGTGATLWETFDATAADKDQPTHWSVGGLGIEQTAVLDLASPTAGAQLLSGVGDIGGFRHDNLDVSPPQGQMSNPVFSNTTAIDFAEKKPELVVRLGTNPRPGPIPAAISHDGGMTWKPFASLPGAPPAAAGAAAGGRRGGRGGAGGPSLGSIAVAADGSTLVGVVGGGRGGFGGRAAAAPVDPTGPTVFYSRDDTKTWQAATGIQGSGRVIADRVDPARFYVLAGSSVFVSTDGGATFAAKGQLPTAGAGQGQRGGGGGRGGSLRASSAAAGDLWVMSGGSLLHSTDSGATFKPLTSTESVSCFGFGKAAPGARYPAIYIVGRVGGVYGIFRSTDAGASWVRINDDQHQFGSINPITGDPKVFGRVYFGTNGRGVFYGDPAK